MTDETVFEPPRITKPRQVSFPWLSSLTGLAVISLLLVSGEPMLQSYYQLPELALQTPAKIAALLAFCFALLLDIYLYQRRQRGFRRDIARMKKELTEVWRSKKQLQLKAHTYAGHADKLKLFISEKLLEYIEYDEKFLHFKSIAAEVRHNGVICFDKVQSALQQALAQEKLEDRDQVNVSSTASDNPSSQETYHDALSAMRYLWDLLDLSTADNIALHIGNQLCECEEHYYQTLLNEGGAEAAPYQPDYDPRSAALKALGPLLQTSPSGLEAKFRDLPAAIELGDDAQFRVYLEPVATLLGNENHFILLLENLLKNAQFFARKKAYRHKYARIAVTLRQSEDQIHLSIYNRGPHIAADKIDQIFQLGYSTRRAREHHGKGLGLFFVQEIVKGYEGRIEVANIHNQPAFYSLRIALASGHVITEVLEVNLEEEQPQCRRAQLELWGKTLEWQLDNPPQRVEITPAASQQTWGFDIESGSGQQTILDPEHSPIPRWAMEVSSQRKTGKLVFMPLDVSGVCFNVNLPSAASRLNPDAGELDQIETDVEALNRPFEALADYRDQ